LKLLAVSVREIDVRKVVAEVEARGFRPDVVVIDTLGRCMGDAEEKTKDFNKIFASLDALRQTYWPGLAEIVLSHTKKGEKVFRGPQVIAGNGDNLMYVIRNGRELRATVTCDGGGFCRNAPEFEAFGFTLAPRKVMTTKGWQDFLVVNALVDAVIGKKTESEKARRERELDELAHRILVGRYEGPESWTESVGWFELTKTHRGALGTTTFSNCIKRLLAKRKISMWKTAKNTFYQAVIDGEQGELEPLGPDEPLEPLEPEPEAPSTPSVTVNPPRLARTHMRAREKSLKNFASGFHSSTQAPRPRRMREPRNRRLQ